MQVDISICHETCPIHVEPKFDNVDVVDKQDSKPEVVEKQVSSNDAVKNMTGESYTCETRVLLVGVGADELFSGYARYFTRKSHDGIVGLRDEMLLDLRRLWERNLGRDDRVLSDHCREARHPFLDENLVDTVSRLPIGTIAGERKEDYISLGLPTHDKWILRAIALELGLERSAKFKKRAIQFGTRIAKNINVALHGSNRKGKGTMNYDCSTEVPSNSDLDNTVS